MQFGGSIWTQRHTSSAAPPPPLENDSIEAYLDSAVVPSDVITQYGGVIRYWESELKRCPSVGRMALNYLTAPGEYTFSNAGCLILN